MYNMFNIEKVISNVDFHKEVFKLRVANLSKYPR